MKAYVLAWVILVSALLWLVPSLGISGPFDDFCSGNCPSLCYCCAASMLPPQGASSLRLPQTADQLIALCPYHFQQNGHLDSIYRPPRTA